MDMGNLLHKCQNQLSKTKINRVYSLCEWKHHKYKLVRRNEKMRKFFKWLGIAVVLLIVLGVIGSIIGGNDQSTTKPVAENKQVKNEPVKKQEPVKKEKKDLITKENYDKITAGDILTGEGGMTKDQVLQMLGKPNNTVESNTQGVDGKSVKTEVISWTNLSPMRSITITFINGKASNKGWLE
jgi:hypothetical protein